MDYLDKDVFISGIKKILNPDEDSIRSISKAWNYSDNAHKGQYRDSNEEYFIHPVRVSNILLKSTSCDVEMIIAALLHDVVEDTNTTINDIRDEFGEKVAILVDGLTKVPALDEIYEKNLAKEISKRDSVQKLFRAISYDFRVALIKLADRLHNLRTLGAKDQSKINRICTETLLIYVPLAEILGVGIIQKELQNLAFSLAYPNEYMFICEKIIERDEEYKDYREKITSIIEDELDEHNIKARVYSRRKEPYSIYSKLKVLELDLEDIYDVYDIIGFRIIVEEESIEDCYKSLSIINNLGSNYRFEDFIQVPRGPHQYMALHKVFINDIWGKVEVQIRTTTMHYNAERGTAPHWKYKMNVELSNYVEQKLTHLSQLIDQQDFESNNYSQIFSEIKDGLKPFIRVLTPNKESVFLPKDATILDFAYHIHSIVGDECVGAKVRESNGKIRHVSVDWNITHLSEIDIIRKTGSKPSVSWITGEKAKTPRAKSRIKAYFHKENRKEAIEKGKEIFIKFTKLTEKHFEILPQEILKKLTSEGLSTEDNLYYYVTTKSEKFKIKLGEFILHSVLNKLGLGKNMITPLANYFWNNSKSSISKTNLLFKKLSTVEITLQDINLGLSNLKSKNIDSSRLDETVKSQNLINTNNENIPILLSNCCNPIDGDKIIGIGSRSGYIKIHRINCINIIRLNKERLIPYNWSSIRLSPQNKLFEVLLEIEFINNKESTRIRVKDLFKKNAIEVEGEYRINPNRREPKIIFEYAIKLKNNIILEEIFKKIQDFEEVISILRRTK